MKRVDIVIPGHNFSQYGVVAHFNMELHKAFVAEGFDSHAIIWNQMEGVKLMLDVAKRHPDCTITVNGRPTYEGVVPLCDVLEIPHLTYTVDAPFLYIRYAKSPFSIFTSVERNIIPFYSQMGFEDMFFLPHATEKNITFDPLASRPFDVVMLGSCIDYNSIREGWKSKFMPDIRAVMSNALDICLAEKNTICYQAFKRALDEWEQSHGAIDPATIDLEVILNSIENYIRGKDKIELIRSIKSAEVHVFGSEKRPGDWRKYLGNRSNVSIHGPVQFHEAIDLMKQSKIVLNSCPTIKDGVHERLLGALACGACVISSDSDYVREQFQDTGSVSIYEKPTDASVDQAVVDFLADPLKRERCAFDGRQVVMERHTWEHRVRQLAEILPPLIEKRKLRRTKA